MSDPIIVEVNPVEMLREENMRLRMDLEECKAQIFDLSYEENMITDATIKKEYEDICRAMEKWIDDVFDDVEFSAKLGSVWERDRVELMDLGVIPSTDPDEFGYGGRRTTWLRQQDTCTYIVISLVMWRFLKERVFSNSFPIGMTEDQNLLLSEILDLKSQELDRSAALRTSRWRSETLSTMVKTESFKRRRDDELKSLTSDFLKQVKYWVDGSLSSRQEDMLDALLKSAVRLHSCIRCSKRSYLVQEADALPDEHIPRDISWTLQNIHTWRKVGYNTIDSSYRVFIHLSPGIYRDEDELTVVNPVVVIYRATQHRSRTPSLSPGRDGLRHTDRLHIRHRSPKRLSHSANNNQSGRRGENITSSLAKYILGPKTKHSETRPKNNESKALVPKSKSATSQDNGHRPRRSSKSHSPIKDRASTMPQNGSYDEPNPRPARSNTEPVQFSSRATEPMDSDFVTTARPEINSASQSVSRLPRGRTVSTTKMDVLSQSIV